MTHGNVTHHFGSANGLPGTLAEAMIRDLVDAVQAALAGLRAGETDARHVIELVFDAFVPALGAALLGRELAGALRLGDDARSACCDRPDRYDQGRLTITPASGAVMSPRTRNSHPHHGGVAEVEEQHGALNVCCWVIAVSAAG